MKFASVLFNEFNYNGLKGCGLSPEFSRWKSNGSIYLCKLKTWDGSWFIKKQNLVFWVISINGDLGCLSLSSTEKVSQNVCVDVHVLQMVWFLHIGFLTYRITKFSDRKGQFFKFIFNWSITALQYCVVFCHTTAWTNHKYTYVPCYLTSPLPDPTPPSVTECHVELPVSYSNFPVAIYFTYGDMGMCMFQYYFLHSSHPLLPWVRSSEVNESRAYYTEWRKSEKNKYHILTYICNLEKWYGWAYLQGRNRDTDKENSLWTKDTFKERSFCGVPWQSND